MVPSVVPMPSTSASGRTKSNPYRSPRSRRDRTQYSRAPRRSWAISPASLPASPDLIGTMRYIVPAAAKKSTRKVPLGGSSLLGRRAGAGGNYKRATSASAGSRLAASLVGLPQHPDHKRPRCSFLLKVNQKLRDSPCLWVAVELPNPRGTLDFGKHQDAQELCAWSWSESVQTLLQQPFVLRHGSHLLPLLRAFRRLFWPFGRKATGEYPSLDARVRGS